MRKYLINKAYGNLMWTPPRYYHCNSIFRTIFQARIYPWDIATIGEVGGWGCDTVAKMNCMTRELPAKTRRYQGELDIGFHGIFRVEFTSEVTTG